MNKNYNITLNKGKLEIVAGKLVLKVKDVQNVYGTAFENAQGELEFVDADNATLNQTVKDNWQAFIDKTAASYSVDPADKYEVDHEGGYAIRVTGVTSTNYEVTVKPGTFTVTPLALTVTAKEQNVNLSDEESFNSVPEIGTTVTVKDADGNNVTGLPNSDNIADLVTLTATNNVGENVITVTDKSGANYTITPVNGVLNITGAPEITLGKDPVNDAATIASYAASGNPVNVKMNFANRTQKFGTTEHSWAAGTDNYWNTLVLPFDISVADLSAVLGYAIVNVFDGVELSEDGKKAVKTGKYL